MKNLFLVPIALIFIASCASRASGVSPISISSMEYQYLTCEETKSLLASKKNSLEELEIAQNKAALKDSLGLFVLAIPLSKIFGGAVEGDLAQIKGEVIAIERALPLNCKKKD